MNSDADKYSLPSLGVQNTFMCGQRWEYEIFLLITVTSAS